ncbi:hypothetical protein A1O3_01820 [Capronia epimyces CBS 606.96]|uniref:Alcohol dehydrogenase n=1 Tax=Capronia epimyces CBS 606.96 TaxID=1182542 RepID=W9YHL2_9EURO|nr:uncharacterized protein A1O3_01820 [Capronia epimyces CBS 606.96]EXJ88756.1 hypothetical protein A1O3_01820 [Capronia epimyces CBS 606.96]
MVSRLRMFWGQSFRLPPPPLTEKNLPDQTGKVFIITGANSGVGYELSRILYVHNATVYVAARSESKGKDAIAAIAKLHPESKGRLEFLFLDLSDLNTIKSSVDDFLRREDKLHWLNNNAGVMVPPSGSRGAQGIDLSYQTNILGPFLFTKLLLPVLRRTAKLEADTPGADAGSVRVSWASSLSMYLESPAGGVKWKTQAQGDVTLDDSIGSRPVYGTSKAANFLLANEFAKRFGSRDGVLHNAYNPGNLATNLGRHLDPISAWVIGFLVYPPILGAYTELYAGLSPDLTIANDQGVCIVPWGRRLATRPDIQAELGKEGGNAEKLFDWCDRVTSEFA